MDELQRRFDAVKKQIEEQQTIKIRLQTQIEERQARILEQTEELQERGITYETLEDLEQQISDREARVEQLLTNMEQKINQMD